MGVTVAPDLPDLLVGALLPVTAFGLSGVEVAIDTIVQRATEVGFLGSASLDPLLRLYFIWLEPGRLARLGFAVGDRCLIL